MAEPVPINKYWLLKYIYDFVGEKYNNINLFIELKQWKKKKSFFSTWQI